MTVSLMYDRIYEEVNMAKTQPKIERRGGRRPGAGRHRMSDELLVQCTIRVTREQLTRLQEIGGGKRKISEAVRKLIDSYEEAPK